MAWTLQPKTTEEAQALAEKAAQHSRPAATVRAVLGALAGVVGGWLVAAAVTGRAVPWVTVLPLAAGFVVVFVGLRHWRLERLERQHRRARSRAGPDMA